MRNGISSLFQYLLEIPKELESLFYVLISHKKSVVVGDLLALMLFLFVDWLLELGRSWYFSI